MGVGSMLHIVRGFFIEYCTEGIVISASVSNKVVREASSGDHHVV